MFEELLPLIIKPISDVLLRVIPDTNARQAAEDQIKMSLISNAAALNAGMLELAKAQAQVNLQEAQSTSMFVSGWRPFVGWICGLGCCVAFLLQPLANWVCTWMHWPPPPAVDLGQLMTLLLGMLGMGSLRTYEKTQGLPDSLPTLTRKK